ncbi:hypothetical protein BDM02DRAFT_1940924 [Thelephora ganbajun]|uniref:Uncharacterized protein n=1 Tax=Thelephora ganbajun TaxID=370292 RepID=A0ACB6ZID2_THEGA|nr:hypothetical protein BDM02DRAFT_1940924 [Thelephora ganbajun]
MERNQPFPDSFYLTNNRRVAGGGVIPTGRYLDFPLRDAGGIDPQLLARRRPIPSYRPGPSPSSITSSSYMDSRRMENESMTLPVGQALSQSLTTTDESCLGDPRRSILPHR